MQADLHHGAQCVAPPDRETFSFLWIFFPPNTSFSFILFWWRRLRLRAGFICSPPSTSESLFSTLTCNLRLLIFPSGDPHSAREQGQHPRSLVSPSASISDWIYCSRFIGSFVFWAVSDYLAAGLTVWIVKNAPSDTKPSTQYCLITNEPLDKRAQ